MKTATNANTSTLDSEVSARPRRLLALLPSSMACAAFVRLPDRVQRRLVWDRVAAEAAARNEAIR